VIFETGEDPIEGLTRFAEQQNLTASSFTAIGAFSEAVLGYFEARIARRSTRAWCSGAATAARAADICSRRRCVPRSR
jgi:predicted DNA-binding protein with PD1-like motif